MHPRSLATLLLNLVLLSEIANACSRVVLPGESYESMRVRYAKESIGDSPNLCVLRPIDSSLQKKPRPQQSKRHVLNYWKISVQVDETLLGACIGAEVSFEEVSGASCGLGMLPKGEKLLAALDGEGRMVWWTVASSPLASQVRSALVPVPAK